jgi:fructose-1,6-bisphosphatase
MAPTGVVLPFAEPLPKEELVVGANVVVIYIVRPSSTDAMVCTFEEEEGTASILFEVGSVAATLDVLDGGSSVIDANRDISHSVGNLLDSMEWGEVMRNMRRNREVLSSIMEI